MEDNSLTWIIQGGSFALVVAMFSWGAYVLAPRVIKMIEDRDAKFESIVERMRDQSDKELDRQAAANQVMISALNAITTRLELLENHGCAHRFTSRPSGNSGTGLNKQV